MLPNLTTKQTALVATVGLVLLLGGISMLLQIVLLAGVLYFAITLGPLSSFLGR